MYYLPLNTTIVTAPERVMRNGTIRPAATVTLSVARETDKAVQMKLTSSRGEDFGDLIWLPKSQITVGAAAVVFHAHWVAEKMKSAFPYREDPFAYGCPSVGYRYPDRANMRDVEDFAHRTLAETGAVTQEQIDAHFAPVAVEIVAVETVETVTVEIVETIAVETVATPAPMLLCLPTKKQATATQKACRQYSKTIKAAARRATKAQKESVRQTKRTARAISIANTATRRAVVKLLKAWIRAAAELTKIEAAAAKAAKKPAKSKKIVSAEPIHVAVETETPDFLGGGIAVRTHEDLLALVARIGIGKDRLARTLGFSQRTFRMMCAGTEPIRPYIFYALEHICMKTDITVTSEMLADYLTADFGYFFAVKEDGSHYLIDGSVSHRSMEYIAAVKCPGMENLDSTVFSDGFAESGTDGIYRGEGFEGDLEALIRFTCEHGDVTAFVEDLETALRDAALENLSD